MTTTAWIFALLTIWDNVRNVYTIILSLKIIFILDIYFKSLTIKHYLNWYTCINSFSYQLCNKKKLLFEKCSHNFLPERKVLLGIWDTSTIWDYWNLKTSFITCIDVHSDIGLMFMHAFYAAVYKLFSYISLCTYAMHASYAAVY